MHGRFLSFYVFKILRITAAHGLVLKTLGLDLLKSHSKVQIS